MAIVLGERVLVEKHKIDCNGLRLTPEADKDGLANIGKVIAVGEVSELFRLKGLVVGATIYFRKHFITNAGTGEELVFVNIEDILGISNS